MSILLIRSIKIITIKMLIMRLSTFKINFLLGIITTIFPSANRTRYISSLPLFTISDELLIKILKRNKLTKSDIKKIIKYKNEEEK